MNYSSRISKVQQKFKESNFDCFFITNFYNILYFTGFRGVSEHEREATLLITRDRATLFISKMYEEEVSKLGVENLDLRIVDRGKDLFEKPRELFSKYKKIGFEGNDLKYSEYEIIKVDNYNLNDASDIISNMRMIKDSEEIDIITQAQEITLSIFDEIKNYELNKFTEIELVRIIRDLAEEKGAQSMAFDTIVASAEGSSRPHYFPKNRKIQNDILLIDMGVKYKNYCSDMTRMLWIGEKNKKYELFQERLELLDRAQKKVLAMVKPGIQVAEIYSEIEKILGFEMNNFTNFHSLGHGVGLEIHEKPNLSSKLDTTLQSGMVVTIEPGLYYPGWGGMRIEDLVVV